jgi:hypothetical protein
LPVRYEQPLFYQNLEIFETHFKLVPEPALSAFTKGVHAIKVVSLA